MTDSELKLKVERAKDGDARAFGELYSFVAADAYRFSLWYIKDPHLAEDAVQDAALKAYKGIKNLKKAASFKSWFMSIVLSCSKDVLSELKLTHNVSSPEEVLADLPYYDSYESGDVSRHLRKLDDKDRTIVLMSALGDFKSGEIASELGMTSVAVRSRLSRALRFLRTEMEKEQ